MAELTKTVDGKALPADKFAYVGDPKDISTWHLPIDSDHVQAALDLFGHEKHVPAAARVATARKIAAAAKGAGHDTTNFTKKYLSGPEHDEASSPWIEIFRAGDYRPQGKALITRADLERVIRNYDPAFHEAPVCVGHPETDGPAYAWIARLALDGDTLLAKESQVDPAFDEARRAGRYKKRSASFYQDAAGNVTGLRHVGWLGAKPPEVKGLKDVQFDDNGRAFIVFGEEEAVAADEKTLEERMKTFFSELFGRKQGEQTFSEEAARRLVNDAVTLATEPLQTKITSLETELGSQKTAFSEREKQIAGAEVKQRGIEAINKLKGAGKWVPAFEKMGLDVVFEELAKTTTVEFGEGAEKKQVTPLQIFVEFMEGLPKIVPTGTHFVGGAAGSGAGAKATGDPLTDAARAREKEKGITFSEALDQVVLEHPELTRPGAASAGAA